MCMCLSAGGGGGRRKGFVIALCLWPPAQRCCLWLSGAVVRDSCCIVQGETRAQEAWTLADTAGSAGWKTHDLLK
jgi:hypothetical protein